MTHLKHHHQILIYYENFKDKHSNETISLRLLQGKQADRWEREEYGILLLFHSRKKCICLLLIKFQTLQWQRMLKLAMLSLNCWYQMKKTTHWNPHSTASHLITSVMTMHTPTWVLLKREDRILYRTMSEFHK